jgi:hypothetical protein
MAGVVLSRGIGLWMPVHRRMTAENKQRPAFPDARPGLTVNIPVGNTNHDRYVRTHQSHNGAGPAAGANAAVFSVLRAVLLKSLP